MERSADHAGAGIYGPVNGPADFSQALLPDGGVGAGGIVLRLQRKTRRTRHIQVGQKRPEAAVRSSILRPHRILYAIVSNIPDPFNVRVKRFRYGGGPGKQVESDTVHSGLGSDFRAYGQGQCGEGQDKEAVGKQETSGSRQVTMARGGQEPGHRV